MIDIIESRIDGIVNDILADYSEDKATDRLDKYDLPDKDTVIDIVDKLIKIVFPGYFKDKVYRVLNSRSYLTTLIEDVAYNLNKQITIALRFNDKYSGYAEEELSDEAQNIAMEFLKKIVRVREFAQTDLQATYDGDPAATSKEEIVFSYPGLYAITVNRLAHELWLLKVPVIPRIMTEYAHSKTGIDIHPGATIGKYFFIDHGTGIVVGESTEIGNNVKIYQGVTLGALSTRGGQDLRNKKRHPTIKDNVTIYSGASILGGDTIIGENVVIGGNAFITKSVADDTKVSVKSQELVFNEKKQSAESVEVEQDEKFWSDYVI